MRSSWRQSDYVQIARNFHREGLNIFYPRIDWRGATPGYVEMEFPVLPWSAGLLSHAFGYQETWLRWLSAVLSTITLLAFVPLCRRLMSPAATLLAVAAVAFNPLLVLLSTSMQPEPLMLLLSLLAVGLVFHWDKAPRFRTLVLSCLALAGAALIKLPALHLGVVVAYVVLRKLGPQAFRDLRIYVAGLAALAPPIAWHLWAGRFWTLYGNSLGVSNESHLPTLQQLVPPTFILQNLKWETYAVLTPAGWLLALAAVVAATSRQSIVSVWYASAWLFYLVASGSSGGDWTFYYHSSSVLPACLLMGIGFDAFQRSPRLSSGLLWLDRHRRTCGRVLAGTTIVALIAATTIVLRARDARPGLELMRHCALQFAGYVPPDERIVVAGSLTPIQERDTVAWNEPMFFAWMDRKGFSYAPAELDAPMLDQIAASGGRYWIARRAETRRPEVRQEAGNRFPLVAECESAFFLYDLKPDSPRLQSAKIAR